MERYRKGNFNQGRKFSRYDSQTSLNLKNINNLNANVELEMGLKVEEKRMFYEEESGKFSILCLRVFDLPPKETEEGGYVIYRDTTYKRTYFPPPFYYTFILLLYYYSILSIPFYLFCVTSAWIPKKNLHRGGGVLGRDCQRPRRQTGSKHERRG